MAEIAITITGIEETAKLLNETAPQAISRGISQSLDDIASEMESVAKNRCPVDTGYLQSSIRIIANGDSIDASVGADYASYVDQGTRKMSAQPFFTDTINEYMAGYASKADKEITSQLE